jgi:hypothetical protein
MPNKWARGWVTLLALLTLPGCCAWCDRHCPHATTYSQPVCCPAPACCPAPVQGPIPAGYQPNWSNPQAAYVPQPVCCQ